MIPGGRIDLRAGIESAISLHALANGGMGCRNSRVQSRDHGTVATIMIFSGQRQGSPCAAPMGPQAASRGLEAIDQVRQRIRVPGNM